MITLSVVGGLVFSRFTSNNPTGEKAGTVNVSGIDFKCRLPVLAGAAGGFISFPDGAVSIDRSLNLSYKGNYGNTYDAQVGKWVPVPRSALSPDGRSYAYLAQTTGVPGATSSMTLHTHEIVSGKDRVLWEGSGSPMGFQVTWLAGGIYFLAALSPGAGPQTGPMFPSLYVADANQAGTPRRVGPNPAPQPPTGPGSYSSPDMFALVGANAAWGTGNRVPKEIPSKEAPSSDRPPAPPVPGTYGPDRILRMDLRDGSVSTWFTVAGTEMVSLMGLDAQGRPILALFEPPNKTAAPTMKSDGPPKARLLLLTGSSQTIEMTSPTSDFRLGSQPSADSHGVWFGGWNAVWFYSPNGGFRQIATIPEGVFPSPSMPPGYPMKGGPASDGRSSMPAYMQGTMVMPAGPCA